MESLSAAVPSKYRALPKVDLHRHLEGSLRLDTMLDIARQHRIDVPQDVAGLGSLVQMQPDETFSYRNFLAKFGTLRLFYRSPEIIDRVTREAVEDAAKDNVRYMELRFTPVALSRAEGFTLKDVVLWVTASARAAAERYGMLVRLVPSVNRHESPELAEQVAGLAAEHMDGGIVGLDLAGNEAEFPTEPFHRVLREARQSGLHLTVHAGEWGPASNIEEAIHKLGAERIGHGTRILENSRVTELAREMSVPFEVCVTSNYQSGVVPSLAAHPLPRMLEQGLNVTLDTDDPSISRITLSHEYRVVCEDLGLSEATLKGRIMAAAQAAFLRPAERDLLVARLGKELGVPA